jgi:hypothetical protein
MIASTVEDYTLFSLHSCLFRQYITGMRICRWGMSEQAGLDYLSNFSSFGVHRSRTRCACR